MVFSAPPVRKKNDIKIKQCEHKVLWIHTLSSYGWDSLGLEMRPLRNVKIKVLRIQLGSWMTELRPCRHDSGTRPCENRIEPALTLIDKNRVDRVQGRVRVFPDNPKRGQGRVWNYRYSPWPRPAPKLILPLQPVALNPHSSHC